MTFAEELQQLCNQMDAKALRAGAQRSRWSVIVRGIADRMAAAAPKKSTDYPECTGDPASCPENEGYGCCKSNPARTDAGDNAILRRLLAIRYAGAALYHEDGELQDNSTQPFIDFKHDAAAEIERKIIERGKRALETAGYVQHLTPIEKPASPALTAAPALTPVAWAIPGFAIIVSAAQKALGQSPGATVPLYEGVPPAVALNREDLGWLVRQEWMAWAREQPNPKPSWLLPWEALTEPEREVDRRIGVRIAQEVVGADTEGLFAKCYAALCSAVADAGFYVNSKNGEMYLTPRDGKAQKDPWTKCPKCSTWPCDGDSCPRCGERKTQSQQA